MSDKEKIINLSDRFAENKPKFDDIKTWIKAVTPLLFNKSLQELNEILDSCPDKSHPRYHQYRGVRDGRAVFEAKKQVSKSSANILKPNFK
ncbi:hypothetical protein Q9L42_020455 (plasmid) [Methylomarinum sp. Ch1-1]|uniref:Uncharacterized protein n=1 Tax=Methylomarinum roseum TaxID=3067653 RepID=A0AAU7P0C9_9GAMM|nr:hypothetical protein [Methylomarinum sp. Ch1-1]MDP4523289.1 hypothetical protein [Methylomarinum sp. Ch1-1]